MNKLAALIVLLLSPLAAHAYIDPGSGMLLIQGLIAVIGAIVVFIKNPLAGIAALFKKLFGKDKP